VQVVIGNGCSLATLREATLDRADLLLAVTDSDEVNMITALMAGTAFQVPTKVVRLRNQEYLDNVPELARAWPGETHGINPDQVAADRILSLLAVPHAVDVAPFLGGRVVVAGFRIDRSSSLDGRTLAQLQEKIARERFLVAAIDRKGQTLLPHGSTALKAGDVAYFSTLPERLPYIVRLTGHRFERGPGVLVAGAGHVGRKIAAGAVARGLDTRVIVEERGGAESLAMELPGAMVIQGDITSEEILLEAGVEGISTFVAASDDQERNVLCSVLAKRHRAARIIVLVDNPTYIAVAEELGIDAVVSPRLASVGEILRFLRGVHVEEVVSLSQERLEVSVVEIEQGVPLAGRPLRDVGLPPGILVTAVATPDEIIIPSGADTIPGGSRAVIFALSEAADSVLEFLEPPS